MQKISTYKLKYVVPSGFTILALAASFYSLLQASSGIFDLAAYGIILAMIFDSLDGRSARLTNTCTKFGASLDSITDMMAYGVAPSIMLYSWGLYQLGKIGYLVCFIFCACAALRLARFNVMAAKINKKYFQGLSSTIAGGFMVTFVLAMVQYGVYGQIIIYIAAILTIISGFLMVSNLKFYSFKEIEASPKLTATILLGVLILLIGLTFKYKGLCVFTVLALYILFNILLQPFFKPKKSVNEISQ